MNRIIRFLTGVGSTFAFAIISAVFAFLPEDFFKYGIIQCDWSWTAIIIMNRILISCAIFVIANVVYCYYKKNRTSVVISGKNFSIIVEYGDILQISEGKKVINFDECFSTNVGHAPKDIKPASICGQYLAKHTTSDIENLIKQANIQPIGISLAHDKPSYELGTIVPHNDHFLMAFTKLDQDGLSRMTYNQYLECLNNLWMQIDKFHGTDDVYIPILGSKITRFDKELTQQNLLNIMVASYLLSPYKMKHPCALHIVCRKREGFSLNAVLGVDQQVKI